LAGGDEVPEDVKSLLDGSPYHVGIVVPDVGEAMIEYGQLFGVSWGPRRTADFPVMIGAVRRELHFDTVYSRGGPVTVELTIEKPGTFWAPGRGIHHIGFFSGDVVEDSDRLAAAGYPVEASLYPLPNQAAPSVAFCRGPQGLFIELVSSELRPGIEASLA
jgi:hypothetical protein